MLVVSFCFFLKLKVLEVELVFGVVILILKFVLLVGVVDFLNVKGDDVVLLNIELLVSLLVVWVVVLKLEVVVVLKEKIVVVLLKVG